MEISAAIYKNDKKGDNPKSPDYSGPATVDGQEKRIVGWISKDKNGKSFISVRINDKLPQQQDQNVKEVAEDFFGKDDDLIAF
jgi:uncharacterized protein (DUF736 family)